MKLNYFLSLLFVLKASFLFAQNTYVLEDKPVQKIEDFEILMDKNYTFEQILNDSTLEFQENPKSYKFETEEYCWFRFSIQNNSAYGKEYYFSLTPKINNLLYYYDFDDEKWKTTQAGLAITDFKRIEGIFSVYLHPNKINTFYVKSKVNELNEQEYPIYLSIYIYAKEAYENKEQFIVVSWLVVTIAMLLFFIYNLYIYFVFRDNTYLYYLIILLGAILYISAFSDVFNFVLPFNFYNIGINSNGVLYAYTTRDILNFGFIWMILFGYIQFTRSYLQLDIYFPYWDTILKYLTYFLSLFSLFAIIIASFKSLNIYYSLALISNLFFSIIILMIFSVGIMSYKNGYKPARYFLIANTLPLLGIMSIALYLLVYKSSSSSIQLLPHLTLLSQTLSFAIALVARINLLKDELKEKQLQAEILEKENGEILARNRYIELENEHIIADMATAVNKEIDLQNKIKSEASQKTELEQKIEEEAKQKADLQAKLEANQRELTANSLYLYQKNEMLTNLQKQIRGLSYKNSSTQNKDGIKEIKSVINNDIQLDSDWNNFKIHFEEVHPNFFKELNEKYPTLTKNEIRLSAYYHLNMSVKEIATLLNINPRSVHKAKSRLNKKIEAIDKEN
ncbi:7TM diverse intracellular signaling domain-containing protein [Bernardetia sp. ABR2-2B]|uniref:7TM diverse intracellular signaling domain-containing protein n=1 Tax=Bernardetia sp. ABR2-2B TaxID=3127472 RepID=UPI0030D5DA4A